MENLILLITFIWTLCMVFGVADLCVTLIANHKHAKHSKLNSFNYKL